MKASIRRQYASIYILFMVGIIALFIVVNNIFLERYYISKKLEAIDEAYNSIVEAETSSGLESEDFVEELGAICLKYNIDICVMDVNSRMKYYSRNGGALLEDRLIRYILQGDIDNYTEIEEENDNYTVRRVNDMGGEYMELFARLENNISFLMRTPVETMAETARLTNRFLLYIGGAGIIAGAVIIFFVSRQITEPILSLNEISKRMVDFDFSAKYIAGGASNEIDTLGENMNRLSDSLKQSIGELKSANIELRKDVEKREQIDIERREFLSNVSHELKTPIALIQGYAEGLKESVNDDAESRAFYCEVIADEAHRMNEMVKSLLMLDNLESGGDEVKLDRIGIVDFIKNYINSAGLLAKKESIDVRMQDYPEIYVWGDELLIENVFSNYFSNAVHYCTNEKYIEITVKEADNNVRVSVFNTGVPIAEDAIPHLFEKFYKVDKARTREYGGNGIGLSVVKAIMDRLGQNYGVENYSNGVAFWFELEKG